MEETLPTGIPAGSKPPCPDVTTVSLRDGLASAGRKSNPNMRPFSQLQDPAKKSRLE